MPLGYIGPSSKHHRSASTSYETAISYESFTLFDQKQSRGAEAPSIALDDFSCGHGSLLLTNFSDEPCTLRSTVRRCHSLTIRCHRTDKNASFLLTSRSHLTSLKFECNSTEDQMQPY